MPLEANTEPNKPRQRAGFVAILGAPNAGKSTLVNFLVGQKVTIVSRKVQTTRFPVRGVFIHNDSQIVLVDTPGVFEPRRRLDRAMVQSAWGGAADADALVHVVDVAAQKNHADDTDRVIEGLKKANRKALLVLNKIDLLERQVLLEMAETLFATGAYTAVFMIAATRGDGVDKLADAMALAVPEGPFLYPADQVADLPTRLLAAEITREKVFERLHDELPYEMTVETETWTEKKDGSVKIDQTIYVSRDGQKGIAIGEGGATLKWIGQAARLEMTELLGRKVHLFLHVKVRSGWLDERARYTAIGLDFDV